MRATLVDRVQVIVCCHERPPCAGWCTTFPSRPHRPPHRPSREARRPSAHRTVRLATTAAVVRHPLPKGDCYGVDPDHREDTFEERTTYARINGDVIEGRPTRLLLQDTRVRWGGVMSGFVVALGVLLLMGALGLAIGVTALGIRERRRARPPRAWGSAAGCGPSSP